MSHTCFKITRGFGCDIGLNQHGPDEFTVVYGHQVKAGLDYGQAAKELGECLMHALACEGNIKDAGELQRDSAA